MGDLWIFTNDGVVECSPRVCNVAERCAFESDSKQVLPSEPISICRGLVELPLLDHCSKDIGDGLVQASSLPPEWDTGGMLGDGMSQLVGDNIQGICKMVKSDTITVSERKLFAVPEGVVVPKGLRLWIVVNSGERSATVIVDGVATKYVVKELDRNADSIIDIVDLSVEYAFITFYANRDTRKIGKVLPIVNGASQD
ncbi:hypothetical protein HG530_001603 [Fusarium avenaceum]|nr:hypothetical protein HG530_001603 [Fusarium avenaceum]